MARTRAVDYEVKREAILLTAARLFSQAGVERSSMAMVATECGYSKALLYHYYDSKETLLFDILQRHMTQLLSVVRDAASTASTQQRSAEDKLGAMIQVLLRAYADFEDQHRILLAGMPSLSAARIDQISAMERELVDEFASVIETIMPATKAAQMLKPVTMSLFGMLNWHYMWFRENGPMTLDEYASLATRLILHGAGEI